MPEVPELDDDDRLQDRLETLGDQYEQAIHDDNEREAKESYRDLLKILVETFRTIPPMQRPDVMDLIKDSLGRLDYLYKCLLEALLLALMDQSNGQQTTNGAVNYATDEGHDKLMAALAPKF